MLHNYIHEPAFIKQMGFLLVIVYMLRGCHYVLSL